MLLSKQFSVALICFLVVTLSNACQDVSHPVFKGRDCEWVSENPSLRCGVVNPNKKRLRNLCRKSCNNCSRSIMIGKQCYSHKSCISGYCSYGMCAWKKKDGFECTENIGCKSRKCVNRICTREQLKKSCVGHSDCASSQYCFNSACLKSKELSEKCTYNFECESRVCSMNNCIAKSAPRENGSGCDTDNQCQSYRCSSGICKDKNTIIIKGNVGDPCFKNNGCNSNYCLNSKCTKKPKASNGQSCSNNTDCQSSLCSSNICMDASTLKINGESCSIDNQCQSGNCEEGVCRSKNILIIKSQIGEPCFNDSGCESNFCLNSKCVERTEASNGQPCSENNDCLSSHCESRICSEKPTELKIIGQSCSYSNQCKSNNCVGGVCREQGRKSDGISCSSNYDCLSNFCNDNGICRSQFFIDLANGQTCSFDGQCQSKNCAFGRCAANRMGTGKECDTDDECISKKCSQGTCLAHNSCEALGGFHGAFDKDTAVLVFIGSGFTDMNHWEKVANDNFNYIMQVEFFNDPEAKFKALYVRESTKSFCNYFCNGIERLLCCEQDIAEVLTDKCFPKKPSLQTIVIHNDSKYGGAGYIDENIATTTTHLFGKPLLVHELGHSFFNFGDEYAYGDSTPENSPNCDVVNCPKWTDLDLALGGGYCEKRGCEGGKYYVGRNSFMKNMALPIGDVNLRFSCCTYLRYTGTSPSYCRKYDNIGVGLLAYCQNDYQGYGGAEVYQQQERRKLTAASSPWWHDDSTSMANEERPRVSSLLSVDLITKDVAYHTMRSDPLMLLTEESDPIKVDIINNATGVENEDRKHHITVFYDTGHEEKYSHQIEPSNVAVPPLDLFNETRVDELPSSISKPKSQVRILIDGSNGKVTKIELNTLHT